MRCKRKRKVKSEAKVGDLNNGKDESCQELMWGSGEESVEEGKAGTCF